MNLLCSANIWNDRIAENLLKMQIRNCGDRDYGGILSPDKGFAEPALSARAADVFLSAYYSPESNYYQRESVLQSARLCMEHLVRSLHEDGTLDLLETNFHDATCNAFCVQVIAYTYRMVNRCSRRSDTENLISGLLLVFLEQSARAMITGGFHTPNHRWVLASALILCWRVLGTEDCRRMAYEYLDEGIDCDDEGEYTEHSVGIYDIACNQSLLILLRENDMPELLEPVLRNLNKLIYYLEPDGSVCTLNSRRQDFGRKLFPDAQLLNCLYALAVPHDQADKRFMQLAGLARFLFRQYEEHADRVVLPHDAGNFTAQFLLNQALAEMSHPALPLICEYRRFFRNSGVVRYRKGCASLTLVCGRPVFFKLQVGRIELMMRASACFYACGQLVSPQIAEIKNGWRLQCKSEWGYMRPLGKQAATSDWSRIPHEKRGHVNMLTLMWEMDVLVYDSEIELRLQITGCDHLPWRLEGILTPGGVLSTDDKTVAAVAGGYALMAQGFSYILEKDCLRWEGGLTQHVYAPSMRNAPARDDNAFTVYNTGFAPYSHTVRLSWQDPPREDE